MGVALLLGAVLAGCGGHSHASRSTSAGAPPATTAFSTTTAAGSASTGATTAASGTSTAPGTTSSTSTTAAGGTHRRRPRSAATFVIGPHDQLAEPLVSVPSGTDVVVTLVSGDGHAHRALVRTTPPHTLRVPAGGRARILLTGLPDGNYVIDLDNGAANGTVAVGNLPIP